MSIKEQLIEAHRNQDWDEAKRLSQLKQREKIRNRQIAHCVDCGIAIQRGRTRCGIHARLKRFYSQALAFGLLMLSFSIHASPAPQFGSVQLGWSYNFVASPSCTNFVVYYGTNSPYANWDGYTNACRCYQVNAPTGSTNLICTVSGLTRGTTYFFTITPLGGGIEGDYCNEVMVTIPKKPDKATNLTPL